MSQAGVNLWPLLGPVYWFRFFGRASRSEGFRMSGWTVSSIALGSALWASVFYIALLSYSYERLVDHVSDAAISPALAEKALVDNAYRKYSSEHEVSTSNDSSPESSKSGLIDRAAPEASSPMQEGGKQPSDTTSSSGNNRDGGISVPPAVPGAIETESAQIVLNDLNIQDPLALDFLACALRSRVQGASEAGAREGEAVRAVSAAIRIIVVARGGDSNCDARKQSPENPERTHSESLAIAQLLMGSFGCEEGNLSFVIGSDESPCSSRLWPWSDRALKWRPWSERSAQWRPASVAKLMGCGASGKDFVCPIVGALLQGALDDVRSRDLLVKLGMIEGLGRWLVLALSLAAVSALCWRMAAFNRMKSDIRIVNKAIEEAAGKGNIFRAESAWIALPYNDDSNSKAPLAHPVIGMVQQARSSHDPTDRDETRVRDVSHQMRNEMQRWWDRLATLITLFPVIGLAATLNGLIHAFSQADRIAAAMGDSRAGAIQVMVGELSASFATTFVALLAMAGLTLWMILLQHSEQRGFDEVAEQVDSRLGYRKP